MEMGHGKQGVAFVLNYLKFFNCLISVCTKCNWIDLVEAGPSGNMQILHWFRYAAVVTSFILDSFILL